MTQTNDPTKNPADLMREMRLKQLTMPPRQFAQTPTQELPRVCGLLMDWPIQAGTMSVVARTTGDASIYTTGTFGVIGGIGHESVRAAAKNCVRVAEKHYADSAPTKEYPYPRAGRVRFYLVCYDEVRVIDADLQLLSAGKDKCADLFGAAQHVVTELRLTTQEQKGKRP